MLGNEAFARGAYEAGVKVVSSYPGTPSTEVTENDIPDVVARFHNMEGEAERTRKEQSFLVPVEEIREKDYDLSMNKYKEVEREVVVYDKPEVIFKRIVKLEDEIAEGLKEFGEKFI